MNFPESADLIGRIQENPDFRILEWASLFGFRSLGGGFTFLFALIRNVSNLIKISSNELKPPPSVGAL